jgi:hypothetical protein
MPLHCEQPVCTSSRVGVKGQVGGGATGVCGLSSVSTYTISMFPLTAASGASSQLGVRWQDVCTPGGGGMGCARCVFVCLSVCMGGWWWWWWWWGRRGVRVRWVETCLMQQLSRHGAKVWPGHGCILPVIHPRYSQTHPAHLPVVRPYFVQDVHCGTA